MHGKGTGALRAAGARGAASATSWSSPSGSPTRREGGWGATLVQLRPPRRGVHDGPVPHPPRPRRRRRRPARRRSAAVADGRRQALDVGGALAKQKVRFGRIVTSPLVRAVETAELVAVTLGFDGGLDIARRACGPTAAGSSLCARCSSRTPRREPLALVGHEPTIGHYSVEAAAPKGAVDVQGRGRAARLATTPSRPASVVWTLSPKRLESVAVALISSPHDIVIISAVGPSAGACGAAATRCRSSLPGARATFTPPRDVNVRHLRIEVALDFAAAAVDGVLHADAGAAQRRRARASRSTPSRCTSTRSTLADGDALALRLRRADAALRRSARARRARAVDVVVRYRCTPRRGLYFIRPDEALSQAAAAGRGRRGRTRTTAPGSPASIIRR